MRKSVLVLRLTILLLIALSIPVAARERTAKTQRADFPFDATISSIVVTGYQCSIVFSFHLKTLNMVSAVQSIVDGHVCYQFHKGDQIHADFMCLNSSIGACLEILMGFDRNGNAITEFMYIEARWE